MSKRFDGADIDELLSHIQDLLDVESESLDFSICITEVSRHVENWIYVVARPDRKGVSSFEYVNALANVETKLCRDDEIEGVMVVPLVPPIGE